MKLTGSIEVSPEEIAKIIKIMSKEFKELEKGKKKSEKEQTKKDNFIIDPSA